MLEKAISLGCVSSGEEMIFENTEAFFILTQASNTCTQSF